MNPTMISDDKRAAVRNGACWMDDKYPDWANKIDLLKLDMNNCHACIIGQTVGNYFDVMWAMDEEGEFNTEDWSVDNGFNSRSEDGYEAERQDFIALETLWTEEVKKRLG